MGLIAYFGTERFEVSEKKALPFNSFQRQTGGRTNTFERLLKKPLTNFTGPGLDSLSFSVSLNVSLGVEPRDILDHWADLANAGSVDVLVVGGKLVGPNLWLLKTVNQSWSKIDGSGRVISATMDLTFEEYVES